MKPLKVISDLFPIPSYSVIILCFFFPFFLIKCGDTTLMSIKGTDLVTGISKKAMDERMKESIRKSSPYASSISNDESESLSDQDSSDHTSGEEKNKGKDISPNIFIIISFLMAIAGIAVHFMKNIKSKHLYHIVFSVAGLAGFLGFYLGFQSKMEDMGNNKLGIGLEGKITIVYGFGNAFYIAAVLFFLILLFFGIYSYFLKNDPQTIYGSPKQKAES